MSKYPNVTVPFSDGMRVTQEFGERPEYYSRFGFNGHEGIDCVPLSRSWYGRAVEAGEVVRDTDDPRDYTNYGNLVVVLNREHNRAWWYAHNERNMVDIGDKVEAGQVIYKMGSSGNVTGAHTHLGLRYADANGRAINTDNGYKGFVDPLPVLLELEGELMPETMEIEKKDWERLLKASRLGDRLINGLGESGNIADKNEALIDRLIEEAMRPAPATGWVAVEKTISETHGNKVTTTTLRKS